MFQQREYQRSFDHDSHIEPNAACQQEVTVAAHAAVDYLHTTAFNFSYMLHELGDSTSIPGELPHP